MNMNLKSIIKQSKKGQVLNTVVATFVGLFVLILIGFAVLLGISSLDPVSFFPAAAENQTNVSIDAMQNSINNLTTGFSAFTTQIPTIMTILGVVVVLAALAILILIVVRIRGASGSAGAL